MRATVRAYAALLDGKVVGLAGVMREARVGKFFVDYKPELEPYFSSPTAWRALVAAHRFATEYKGPIVAIAENAEGCRNLVRLGWIHLGGRYYGWPKQQ